MQSGNGVEKKLELHRMIEFTENDALIAVHRVNKESSSLDIYKADIISLHVRKILLKSYNIHCSCLEMSNHWKTTITGSMFSVDKGVTGSVWLLYLKWE
jgi:hypothetical protein